MLIIDNEFVAKELNWLEINEIVCKIIQLIIKLFCKKQFNFDFLSTRIKKKCNKTYFNKIRLIFHIADKKK